MFVVSRRCRAFICVLAAAVVAVAGCARLPYKTSTVYEGPLVDVSLQKEIERKQYTHPNDLTAQDVAAVLRGFSLRKEQRLPLRWFAQEEPPKPILRSDEIELVSSYIADGLKKAGPDERVHFQLFAPGMNRAETRTVTSGWIAVREPFLYLGMEYFRTEVPLRTIDTYYMNNPLMPPLPEKFLLFFEPGRYWTTDDKGMRVLAYRDFLKSAPDIPNKPPSRMHGTP